MATLLFFLSGRLSGKARQPVHDGVVDVAGQFLMDEVAGVGAQEHLAVVV
ncbi:hypothetical protein [Nonomuraea sp. NPDC002799]